MSRKQEIMEVALKVFQNGIKNASLKDVADACNIKTPSMYSHFKSKEELIQLLYVDSFGAYAQALKDAMVHDNAKDNLHDMIKCIYNMHDEDAIRFNFLIFNQFEFLSQIDANGENNLVDIIHKFVDFWQGKNEIRSGDTSVITMAIIGMVQQQAIGHYYGRVKSEKLSQAAELVFEMCWNAIKK